MVLGNVSGCWATTATMGKQEEQAAFPDGPITKVVSLLYGGG